MSEHRAIKKTAIHVPGSYWEDLANAIVIQAVDDYLAAHKTLHDDSDNYRAKLMQKDVLDFLKSDWYKELTNVDPRIIIGHLENKTGTDIDF